MDKSGIGGIVFDYQDGCLCRKAYVNLKGELIYGENGYAEKRITWEGSERISTCYDPNGVLILCRQGYAKAIERFDDMGDCLSVSYYGLEDEPVYCNRKYHEARWTYDDLGQATSRAFFGTDGNPVQSKDGYAKEELVYDSRGNLLSRSIYGVNGQQLLAENHAAAEERTYDRNGYLKETAFYGIDGKPVLNDEAYHREVRSYDEKGRLTELRYFGINGEAEYKQEAACYYHAAVFAYDRKGNVSSVSLMTTEDRLIASVGDHWAKKEMTYNGGGQVETVKYTDLLGNLIDIPGNYAYLVNTYDDRGLLTSTSHYDKTGQLSTDLKILFGVMQGERPYAKVEFDYDDLGNAVETRYYGVDNELMEWWDCAIEKAEFDELGRIVHFSFLDADGNPVEDHNTDIYVAYDKRSNLIEYLPMSNEDRRYMFTEYSFIAYGEKRTYDERSNMVERLYLNADGSIKQRKVIEYDENCLPTAEMFYDQSGSPVLCPDGYWKKLTEYDERNNEVHISYFNTDGRPITLAGEYSQVVQEYNAENVLIRKAFLDEDGKLVNCPAGYAYIEQTATEWRSPSTITLYDKNERELFSYHVEYNGYGQKTAEWLAGPDGAYLNYPSYGIALIRYFYNENRNRVREEYYDENGSPADVWGITSGWESKYSDFGFELERSNLRDGFKPAADNKGIVTAIFDYDALGREIRRTFVDENREEQNCIFGFSRYQIEYGEDGEIQKTTYWDEDGEEVTGVDGEVEKVVLSLGNGDYTIKETELGTLAFTPITYNVNRIAYHQGDDYDMMLQYRIPFTIELDVQEIISAALKRYAKALDGDAIDMESAREDGAEIKSLMDEYLHILQEGGDTMELFGNMNIDSTMKLLEPYSVRMPTKMEVMEFYKEFYDNELENVRSRLQSEYGEGFVLSYRITDMDEFSSSTIQAARAELEQYEPDVSLEDMINLEVEYKVEGDGKSDVLSDGFFYSRVALLKFDGSWTLGTSEGFPAPETTKLAELYGIESLLKGDS